jgi:glutathione S-transferase
VITRDVPTIAGINSNFGDVATIRNLTLNNSGTRVGVCVTRRSGRLRDAGPVQSGTMITIHHLGISQSDRVVWLMEELGLPYQLRWYDRGPDRFMPPEYLALHPAATAPVVQDGERTLVESAVILEYVCHKYAGGRLTVGPNDPNYADYLYWMHWNNNVQGLFFAKLAMSGASGGDAERIAGFIQRRTHGYYNYLNQRLGQVPYLAGSEFTCADIMVTFNLTSLPLFGGQAIAAFPNAESYVKRIGERPAYQRAMQVAGPAAKPAK